jgi:hypothetical protein
MHRCIFCHSSLDDRTTPEHVLLQALGGRKTTKRVVCNSCNNDFGASIDRALAKSVEPLRNIGNFKSGNRRSPPMIRNVEAGGDVFNLMPGAVPTLQIDDNISFPSRNDGRNELIIKANSEEEFARLLDAAAAKLKLSTTAAEQLKSDAWQSAKLHSKPAPSFGFQTSYGDVDSQRSMAKACLVLWADAVGTDEVRLPRYDAVRAFILGQEMPETGRDFISSDTRPLPKLHDKFGRNPNIVWAGSDGEGRVMGYFRLYGAIGWSIQLAGSGASASRSFGLISNPEEPSNWSDTSDAVDVGFAWVAERPKTLDIEAVRTSFGGLLRNARYRAFERLTSEIVEEAFERFEMVEGQQPSKEQWEKFSRYVAWKLVHAAMKMPYLLPMKSNETSGGKG